MDLKVFKKEALGKIKECNKFTNQLSENDAIHLGDDDEITSRKKSSYLNIAQ